MGALVAASYAFAVPARTVVREIERLRILDFARIQLYGRGLFSNAPLLELTETLLPEADIADATVRLSVVCTDLVSGKAVVLERGPVRALVAASCTFAGLMEAMSWNGMELVDGGYCAVLPDIAKEGNEVVIAIDARQHVTQSQPMPKARHILSLKRWKLIGSTLARVSDILFLHQSGPVASRDVDLIIAPPMEDVTILAFRKAQRVAEEGFITTALALASMNKDRKDAF
jgi:predicted acylesterase/phospholipase RssA